MSTCEAPWRGQKAPTHKRVRNGPTVNYNKGLVLPRRVEVNRLATSSLPVPLAPVIKTLVLVGATRPIGQKPVASSRFSNDMFETVAFRKLLLQPDVFKDNSRFSRAFSIVMLISSNLKVFHIVESTTTHCINSRLNGGIRCHQNNLGLRVFPLHD